MSLRQITKAVVTSFIAISQIATAASSSTIWDGGMPTQVLKSKIPGVPLSIDWHPSSQKIALGGLAGMMVVVDVGSGEMRNIKQDREVRSVKFSPDGRLLAIGKSFNKEKETFVKILETDRYLTLHEISAPVAIDDKSRQVAYVSSISFDSTSRMMAIGGFQRQWQAAIYRLGDHANGPVAVLGEPEASVVMVAFQPGSQILAIGKISAAVELYSIGDNKLQKKIQAFDLPWSLTALFYKPDGKTMYALSNNGIKRGWRDKKTGEWREATNRNPLIVWNTEKYDIAKNISLPETGISSVAITPDGGIVVVGTQSGRLTLINILTGHTSTISTNHKAAVKVSISPDGSLLATAGIGDGLLKIWKLNRPQ